MARMTRVSPPELERVFPGPHESRRVTSAPIVARWNAVQPPNAPAPMTATRSLGAANSVGASRRATIGTAATHPRNVRLDITCSEINACAHSISARLIRQESDARSRAALLIESKQRGFVRGIVDIEGRVPPILQDTDPEVDDVVRRKLRIEGE